MSCNAFRANVRCSAQSLAGTRVSQSKPSPRGTACTARTRSGGQRTLAPGDLGIDHRRCPDPGRERQKLLDVVICPDECCANPRLASVLGQALDEKFEPRHDSEELEPPGLSG